MKKTVLITGASSGIGKASALYFAQRGWNVAATMRRPELETELQQQQGIRLFSLDVTQPESIEKALADTLAHFGRLDVVVNNAGYAIKGAFEAASPEQIQRQFDTNVFGLMQVVRAVLPYFRQQGQGTIINVASVGGRLTFPLYSLYHSTKWAVEGFSESLQYELAPLGIRIKIIEPGPIKTDFYDRSQDLVTKEGLTAYTPYQQAVLPLMDKVAARAEGPEVVAKTIYSAATDGKSRLRYASGRGTAALLLMRRLLSTTLFMGMVRRVAERGRKQGMPNQ
ncbi:SDR family oxidoreductase [Cesiribacter andamanensis]|uniref:Serine 3-dehydrogenase n=1 Tax=Cesiribacter andamanensis AMV16 TaxID=1279009 RepID=M7N9D5_9BACT|nr:SDR family oxidoreductase [Cesiribacter andamanensis]EMR03796.1 Serine 3-dehydrogenase [Cesiribacter andamanensis AMV16]